VAKSGIAGGGPGADGGPGAGGEQVDRAAAAADELYRADPGEFTGRRKALADDAKAAGDAAAATRIAALRKPTRAAWVVNQLARTDPAAPAALASLAADLRAAEAAKDGHRLRELSASRGPLVDGLTAQALRAAGVPDPPSALREEVTATLTAAIADPDVAADFAAGTLTRAAQWAGFGLASFPGGAPGDGTAGGTAGTKTADEAEPAEPGAGDENWRGPASGGTRTSREAPAAEPALDEAAARPPDAGRRLRSVPAPEVSAPARSRAGRSAPAPGRLSGEEQARRAQAEQERLAEEAARRAAQRRQAYQDAERTAASTASAAAEAGAAEDQLEAEVRDLEQRLTQARADLAAARMRARRTEAAERRARQALDRLPRPD
jgi:hypothetical protein